MTAFRWNMRASKGIPVTNTPEVLNDDVADLAIALMIMTARRLVASDRYVRAGRWPAGGRISPGAAAPAASGSASWAWAASARQIGKRAEAMNNTIAYHTRRPVADVPYSIIPTWWSWRKNSDFLIVIIPATPADRTRSSARR